MPILGVDGSLLVVNNAQMPVMEDISAIFEDDDQLSNMIYKATDQK